MNACLEGERASFLVASAGRVPVAAAATAVRAVPEAWQPSHNGEVERLLHDSERLTAEVLNDIRAAIRIVSGRPGG
jgi:hypothetical protein